MHDFCLEVITVDGNELRLFLSQPLLLRIWLAAVGRTFNVFSYNAIWPKNRTHHSKHRADALRVTSQSLEIILCDLSYYSIKRIKISFVSFSIYASITKIVLKNNAIFGYFKRNEMFFAIILFYIIFLIFLFPFF